MNSLRHHYPHIHRFFATFTLKDCRPIYSEEGDAIIDIEKEGQRLYAGDAREQAEQEVERFLKRYPSGAQIHTVDAPLSGDYTVPRLFARCAEEMLKQSPIQPGNYQKGFYLPSTYPSIMMLGLGLGFHLSALLARSSVDNIYIIESDAECFYLSLFTIDWSAILEPFDKKKGTVLDFRIGVVCDFEGEWQMLWNKLITLCPYFPVATLFYNHKNTNRNKQLIKRVEESRYAYLASWGHYDDELCQLIQAVHNERMSKGASMFKKGESPLTPFTQPYAGRPIVVVGSGPSLDDRIETLKNMVGRSVVISCGSALSVLHAHNIVPDIHCELEADYTLTVATYDAINDSNYLKKITLVAPLHVNPHVITYFSGVLFFLREGGAVEAFFNERMDTLDYCEPSCTNLGVAFALRLGGASLYLFGMDFGYKEGYGHHSKKSAYYDASADPALAQADARVTNHLFAVEGVEGKPVLTRSDYFLAKWRLERCLEHVVSMRGSVLDVFNLSDGAAIQGAQYLSLEQIPTHLERNWDKVSKAPILPIRACLKRSLEEATHIGLLEHCDGEHAVMLRAEACGLKLAKLGRDVRRLLLKPIEDVESLSKRCNQINHYLRQEAQQVTPEAYFLVLGSFRHFLYIGMSHAMMLGTDAEVTRRFLSEWQQRLVRWLEVLPIQYKARISEHSLGGEAEVSALFKQSIHEASSVDDGWLYE